MREQRSRIDRIADYVMNVGEVLAQLPWGFLTPMIYIKLLGRLLICLKTSRAVHIIVIFIIFINCFICIWELVLMDKTMPKSMSLEFYSASSLCHMIRTDPAKMSQQRCYPLLINFGHRCCRRSQKDNCVTGLKHGIRQCLMFNQHIFDNDPIFANHNKNILNRKRGAGYWLWKPYMLLKELYLARDGDIIVYSDASVNFVANISYLTNLTANQDIVVFKLTGWKVRDTFYKVRTCFFVRTSFH
jgi:hypothetical protein